MFSPINGLCVIISICMWSKNNNNNKNDHLPNRDRSRNVCSTSKVLSFELYTLNLAPMETYFHSKHINQKPSVQHTKYNINQNLSQQYLVPPRYSKENEYIRVYAHLKTYNDHNNNANNPKPTSQQHRPRIPATQHSTYTPQNQSRV